MFVGKDLFANAKSKRPNRITEMRDWTSENVPKLEGTFLNACNTEIFGQC